SATPSMTPTMLAFAPSVCVRKIGRTGYSISAEMSAKRLAAARRKVFAESPEKYFLREVIASGMSKTSMRDAASAWRQFCYRFPQEEHHGGIMSIQVSSEAFAPDEVIPSRFTADGQNVSP